jgi:ubiquinone/menaquinone biosynthesis C-methylase UbiE
MRSGLERMRSQYRGRRARRYDARWQRFTERTHAQVFALSDSAALRRVLDRLGRPARALDVACGTGVLLRGLLDRVPGLDAYGVDASADMLAQARTALAARPTAYLELGEVGSGVTANLPYPPAYFDLITCANALHYFADPVASLAGLGRLLAPDGHLVVEDYARRGPPFPWRAFEWLVRRADPEHIRAYTLEEACRLCTQAGLAVRDQRAFDVDWLWRGWVVRAGV